MQLREMVREIRRLKDWTQVELANYIHVSQQNIQGIENAGTNQEKLYSIIVKLLPLCRELNIDPVRTLCKDRVAQVEGELQDAIEQEADKKTRATHKPPTHRRKTKDARPIPSGRAIGRKR